MKNRSRPFSAAISGQADMRFRLFETIGDRRSHRREEEAVAKSIEKLVRHRCPNLVMTRRNRHALMGTLHSAIHQVSAWIDEIPGPIVLAPERWETDPVLNALFVSPEAVRETIQSSKGLFRYFKTNPGKKALALLLAGWREKSAFGTAKDGEIVRRDVLRKAAVFEDHRLVARAAELSEAKTALEKKALVFLCEQTFAQTQDLKEWQADLERQRELLKFKMGPAAGDARDDDPDKEFLEEGRVLDKINRKIESIKKELGTSEDNFRHMVEILSRPQEFMKIERVSLRISRMGFVLNRVGDSTDNVLSVARYQIRDMPQRAAIWVSVDRNAAEGA